MKSKICILLTIICVLFCLCSCNSAPTEESAPSTESETVILTEEEDISESTRFEKIKAHFGEYPTIYKDILALEGVYIEANIRTIGQEYIDTFLEKVENNEPASVEIIRLTTEGDPIFYFVEYDGEEFYYFRDASRDAYAGRDVYTEGVYQYMTVEKEEVSKYWLYNYRLTNEPQITEETYPETALVYTRAEDKKPEEIIPIYYSDYEKVCQALEANGYYWESDTEAGEIFRIVDGKAENPDVWDAFCSDLAENKICQINIQETFSDGRTLNKWIHYAGEGYWQKHGSLVDVYVYFENDPQYIPFYSDTEDWDLASYKLLYGGAFDHMEWEKLYIFEEDQNIKVGAGHDDSKWGEKLTEEDYGVMKKIIPIIEFTR